MLAAGTAPAGWEWAGNDIEIHGNIMFELDGLLGLVANTVDRLMEAMFVVMFVILLSEVEQIDCVYLAAFPLDTKDICGHKHRVSQ